MGRGGAALNEIVTIPGLVKHTCVRVPILYEHGFIKHIHLSMLINVAVGNLIENP